MTNVHPLGEPFLALFDVLFGEGHLQLVVVVLAGVLELDAMPLHVGEVLLCLFCRRGTQTCKLLLDRRQ